MFQAIPLIYIEVVLPDIVKRQLQNCLTEIWKIY